jgi:type IV secretory pathway VirB3-like protein
MQALQSSRVNKSLLTADMTTFGVDDWLFVININVAIIMMVMLRIVSWGWVALAMHFVLMLVTRVSPNILLVYGKHLRQRDRYFAGYVARQSRGLRPAQLGRREAS